MPDSYKVPSCPSNYKTNYVKNQEDVVFILSKSILRKILTVKQNTSVCCLLMQIYSEGRHPKKDGQSFIYAKIQYIQ